MELVAIIQLISSLTSLAGTAKATIDDAERAWELIKGITSKDADQVTDADVAEIEAEIEELEARGLKPVAPPED